MNTPSKPAEDFELRRWPRSNTEQWMHWSQAVASEVSSVTQAKWQRSWIAYDDLTDGLKEADRIWARKVAALLRERRLIP
ncbi:MAG: hypothetical protein U1F83_05640 [Verrucomicrobiota bacterium]